MKGAHNIAHIISGTILPMLSREILAHMSGDKMPSRLHLDRGKEGTFEITFKE